MNGLKEIVQLNADVSHESELHETVDALNVKAFELIQEENKKRERYEELKKRVPTELAILQQVQRFLKDEFFDLEFKEDVVNVNQYTKEEIKHTYLFDPLSNTKIFVTDASSKMKKFKRFIHMNCGHYQYAPVSDLKVRRIKDIDLHIDGIKIELYNNRAEFDDKLKVIDKEKLLKEKILNRIQKRHEGLKVTVDYASSISGNASVTVVDLNPNVRLHIQYRLKDLNSKQWKIEGMNVSVGGIRLKDFYIIMKSKKENKGSEGKV